jgi:signal transduction histidine kinase
LSVDGETVTLTGWDDAPIATRHVAERFAGLVTESARRLTVARQLVEAEREARLAELGALAATVAHDLRNPLGIVQMAATGAPPEIRSEIGEQVARMNHLVTDILDYACAWTIVPQPLIVADLVAFLRVEANVPDSLMVMADRHALLRALTNPIDICDDGPGIAPEISGSLFRPFVSRRPGGTSLGLAIVRRIMEAHGGTVALVERPGWSTCFRLTFGASR